MLDINPLLMLLVFVVFVVCVYLLNEWLYKPLLAFMDNRDQSIKRDLDSIHGNDLEITALKVQADEILNDARRQATTLREEAQKSAKEEMEAHIEAKKIELDKQRLEYLSSLEEEKKLLHGALLSQMSLFKEALKIKLKQL